jgi:pimeloyl-ACP methyl ester carboxylesterase
LHYRLDDLRPPWSGEALPVFFHHGIGTTMGIWAGWIPVVGRHHPLLRFDMRGFGGSEIPPEEHAWSIQGLVRDLWEVADVAGCGRVHLVGESLGGSVVLAATLERPERVASVTVSNATHRGQGVGEIAAWRARFAEGGVAGWSARMMETRFAPGACEGRALAWFAEVQAKTRPHVAMGLARVLSQLDLGSALASLAPPLSIVVPDSSPFVPVEHAIEMFREAPSARLRVVPGVRHGLPFSHAEEEAQHLLEFLAALE